MRTKKVELWVAKTAFRKDFSVWHNCRMPRPDDALMFMKDDYVLVSVEVPLKERKIEVSESQIWELMEYFDYNSEEVVRELFGADDD